MEPETVIQIRNILVGAAIPTLTWFCKAAWNQFTTRRKRKLEGNKSEVEFVDEVMEQYYESVGKQFETTQRMLGLDATNNRLSADNTRLNERISYLEKEVASLNSTLDTKARIEESIRDEAESAKREKEQMITERDRAIKDRESMAKEFMQMKGQKESMEIEQNRMKATIEKLERQKNVHLRVN